MKRSAQVALLFGGVTAAGAGGYAMLPRDSCEPSLSQSVARPGATVAPALAAPLGPGAPAAGNPCGPRSSRSSSSGYSGRSGWWGSSSSTTAAQSGTTSTNSPRSSSTSRGGFGSTAHAVGSHSSS
jgi:hypothetical protein